MAGFSMKSIVFFVFFFLVVSCGGGGGGGTPANSLSEVGGACITKSDCVEGLLCVNDICTNPEVADDENQTPDLEDKDISENPDKDIPEEKDDDSVLPDSSNDIDDAIKPDETPDLDVDKAPEPVCGDSKKEGAEECDAGKDNGSTDCAYNTSCPKCSSDCKAVTVSGPKCGDSKTDSANGETCDDGNVVTEKCVYGTPTCKVCDATCHEVDGELSLCGDGTKQSDEECDEGLEDNGNTDCAYGDSCEKCSTQCKNVVVLGDYCGDGTEQSSEEDCDLGDSNGKTECTYSAKSCTVCTTDCLDKAGIPNFCGDDNLDAGNGEACDEGSDNGNTDCPYNTNCAKCTKECKENSVSGGFCGDGEENGDEACDYGDNNGKLDCAYGVSSCNVCTDKCLKVAGTVHKCGDGLVDQGKELCDDGNTVGGDYCTSNCQTVSGSCGDGTKQNNEACDDSNTTAGDYCAANCKSVTGYCGDGIKQTNESCDDDNTTNGDGCSSICVFECPANSSYFNDHCYKHIVTTLNFVDAENNCRSAYKGSLVSISGADENTFVDNLSGSNFWIGFSEEYLTTIENNDSCANAAAIDSYGGRYYGDTAGGINNRTPSCQSSSSSPDVFFKFVPAISGSWKVQLVPGSGFDPVLSILEGSCAGTETCKDTNGTEEITMTMTAGTTYYIVVDGYGTNENGAFELVFYQPGKTRSFIWTDSSSPSYFNWDTSEPSNTSYTCAEMKSNGKWNDTACTDLKPSVCEFTPPECGNDILEFGEECENTQYCDSDCSCQADYWSTAERTCSKSIVIGNEASGYNQKWPLGSEYGYERSSTIYTADEIGGFAKISKIGWSVTSTMSKSVPIKIYLKTTASSSFAATTWSALISDATLVYDSSFQVSTANQWFDFTFTTPFDYSANNLMVLVETNYGGGGSGLTTQPACKYTTTATDTHQTWKQDNTAPTGTGSVSKNRPNIKITRQ